MTECSLLQISLPLFSNQRTSGENEQVQVRFAKNSFGILNRVIYMHLSILYPCILGNSRILSLLPCENSSSYFEFQDA